MNRLEKLENELNINYGKNTVKRWREELKYFKVIRFEWDKGSFADAFILRYEFMTKRHLLFFCEFLEILPIFKNESEIAIDEKWEYSDVLYGFKSPGWMKINKQDVYVSHCNGKDSKIIELDKTNQALTKQIETEQNDVKLYQQEVSVLNEQVKVAQDGQENILQRFNANRDKQEQENNKVRETIKFLRDENHQLTSESGELKAQYTEQINDLELKLTEYRLKFEYAQKQLAN